MKKNPVSLFPDSSTRGTNSLGRQWDPAKFLIHLGHLIVRKIFRTKIYAIKVKFENRIPEVTNMMSCIKLSKK